MSYYCLISPTISAARMAGRQAPLQSTGCQGPGKNANYVEQGNVDLSCLFESHRCVSSNLVSSNCTACTWRHHRALEITGQEL